MGHLPTGFGKFDYDIWSQLYESGKRRIVILVLVQGVPQTVSQKGILFVLFA